MEKAFGVGRGREVMSELVGVIGRPLFNTLENPERSGKFQGPQKRQIENPASRRARRRTGRVRGWSASP